MDYKKIISLILKALLAILLIQTSYSNSQKLSKKKLKKFEAPPSNYSNKRFNEWSWLTAHNSHLNWQDSSVVYMARNQELSIDEQLQFGVRGFMFDIDEKTCSTMDNLFGTCTCEGNMIVSTLTILIS